MWTKPYEMKEGFLIGGGLIFAGLMLELSVGPVEWDAFRWPVNGVVLAGFLVMIAIIFLLRKRVYGFQFIGTYKAAIPALIYAVVLTIVMGLTRQTVNGVGLNNMLSFWPFVLMYVYLAVILGIIILRRLVHLADWKRDIPFLLNHLGLFLAITTATLGNADMQRLKMITVVGEPEWRALSQEGSIREMPLAIELKAFVMETYDDADGEKHPNHRRGEQTRRGGWVENLSIWLRHTDGCHEPDEYFGVGERPVVAVGVYRHLHDACRSRMYVCIWQQKENGK
jgi:hypothetical protein